MTKLTIEAAAARLGISVADALQLGADGALPIYVVPAAHWRFRAIVSMKTQETELGPDFLVSEVEISGPLLAKIILRIPPLSIENYINYPSTAVIDTLLVAPENERSSGLVVPAMGHELRINECRLVVKDSEIDPILKSLRSARMPRKLTSADREARVQSLSLEQTHPEKPYSTPPAENNSKGRPDMLRIADVATMLGLSENTIRNYVKNGDFPEPLRLGVRTVAWKRAHIEEWLRQRPGK